MNHFVNTDLPNALKKLYDKDEDARAILDWFETRQNDAREVSVERAGKKAAVEYLAVLRVFRELENIGCGRLLMGRKGHRTRLAWDYSIRSLGAAARGGVEEIQG